SSCVPASTFESPRRALNDGDLEGLLRRRRVLGLAEMMNFPGVIAGDESELSKLRLQGAQHVDGHAPGIVGKELNAYAAAGSRSRGRARLRDAEPGNLARAGAPRCDRARLSGGPARPARPRLLPAGAGAEGGGARPRDRPAGRAGMGASVGPDRAARTQRP